jgi:hypothetical protein
MTTAYGRCSKTGRAVAEHLEELMQSLLWEGYALYPYTSAATKNATPTPFGIAYPPSYAARLTSTFDRVEMRCQAQAPPEATITASVRFLTSTGDRHEATDRQLELPARTLTELTRSSRPLPAKPEAVLSATTTVGRLTVALSLTTERLERDLYELAFTVRNHTPCDPRVDRATALTSALISTHPVLRILGGRFISPLERPCASVNTFPVLASEEDDVLLGAAIVLPDHPRIAPESRGLLFDSTEIEEALLLHVKALSEAERDQIGHEDPHVRAMIERAAAATPEDVLALHGRMMPLDAGAREPFTPVPPQEPADLPDPTLGEPEAEVGGRRLRRGGKVRLRPREDADLHARMLDGRVATVERILVDVEGRTHLGVTIDGEPGQQLLRETGRLLFFFPPEVEVIDA